ncbi:GPI anchored cell wall protein [Penicillium sp. DV-2018c]|nr:GPI anchored cell wall protein [Penicillium sp. DV-2018c]
MKNFIALAALAAGTNALVSRTDSCCFQLTSSGGASGKLGQLDDGQNRIGDSNLSAAQYCINLNGEITDAHGRGCILTPPTTQFQCDEGSPSTPGFSISSKGELEHDGSKDFVACATGQNGGLNVYTHPDEKDVTGCVKVKLHADTCAHSGSSSGSGASSSAAVHTSSGVSSHAATGSVPAPSSHAGSTLPGSPQTVVSTVTVTDCSCTASGAPGVPGVPGAVGSSAPGAHTSVSGGGGAAGGVKPSGSQPAPSGGVGIKPSTTAPAPSGGGGGGAGSMPSGSSSVSVPHAGGGLATHTGGSASASASGSGVGTHPAGAASSSRPEVGGGGGGAISTRPASAASSASASSVRVSSVPVVSIPVPSASGAHSVSTHPAGSASGSAHASSASPTHSATESATAACPTTLQSGEYEIPHLIIPIDSSSPDTAPGTSYNGTVTSSISSVFNFDIPASDAGKACSLVFLFPELQDLETSSYSFSGDGKINFAKLSAVAQESTSFKNAPSVSQNLGDITVSPGNSYVVSTFACPAGEAVAYEMKNAGSTDLNFFQDWNPSPLGLFITTC